MSPRHNRKHRAGRPRTRDVPDEEARDGGGVGPRRVEEWADGDWIVRAVAGAATGKVYRCPGCDQQIPSGVPHLVTWPADLPGEGLERRRHWHRPCWQARDRRRVKVHRSKNAPRYG